MQRLLIRHINGKRANQTDQFPIGSFNDILIGRDEAAAVRFDPEQDDLVSRQHVKIAFDQGSNTFQITDLQSRNGTFLNRQRLYTPARISHGDTVQLGPGGPEFLFELEPPPASIARPTREIGASDGRSSGTMRATREMSVSSPSSPRPVGRATVERMLGDTFSKVKRESNKTMWVATAAAILLLAGGSFLYIHMRTSAQETAAAEKQQQELIQQMTPQTAAMRAQISQLQADIKGAAARDQKSLNAVAQIVAAQQKAAESQAHSPQTAQKAGQPSDASSPAAAPAQDVYSQHAKAVMDLWNGGQQEQAVQSVSQLIASNPQRWEGFWMAGNFLKAESKLPDALLADQQALALSPPDTIKPQIQAAIQQISMQMTGSMSQ